MKVLSIETSTSSAKAMIYDSQKGVLKTASSSYGPEIDKGGVMNVEKVFDLVCSLARQVTEGQYQIEAVGVCETWHNMCAFNRDMTPASDLYSWNYTGFTGIWDKVRKDRLLTDEFYKRTGCMPHTTYSRTAIKYLKDKGFDVSKALFATQGAYNFYKLTGCLCESACEISGSGLLNLQNDDYDEFILDYLNVGKNQFGKLVSYSDTLPLTEHGAKLLGVKKGIPVVPAHGDGAMNVVAIMGCRPGVVTMSVGTSGAIRMVSDKVVTPDDHSLWCYRGARGFVSGAATNGACNCINWFKNEKLKNEFSYAQLEEGFDPSSDYPVFLPFIYGERCPGWNDDRRDGFIVDLKKYSVNSQFQAVEMGVLFNLYQSFESLEKMNGKVNEIILSGGITNSKQWMQMACDIFGHDFLISSCPDASTIGSSALALKAIGAIDDINHFDNEYKKLTKIKYIKENHTLYKTHFDKYLNAYFGGA